MSATAVAAATTLRRGGLVLRDLARGLALALAAFMGIIAIVFALIGVGMALGGNFDDDVARSAWENSAYATRYFPLALGIMLTPTFLPAYVAHGVTRRSFAVGAAAAVLLIAAVMAVLEAAGYLIEDGVYRLAGADQEFTTPHLFDSGAQAWVVVPEVWIVVAANVAAGWLIGSAYYRWSWFGPTLALPLLLAPMLVVEALMSVGWAGTVMIDILGVDRGPLWLVIPASLAVLAVNLLLAYALIRRVAVRPRQA